MRLASIKAKPLNLADNTVLYVTFYTSDTLTGEIYAPAQMAGMSVVNKVGVEKSTVNIFNLTSGQVTRQLDRVVVTTADGKVVFSAHP